MWAYSDELVDGGIRGVLDILLEGGAKLFLGLVLVSLRFCHSPNHGECHLVLFEFLVEVVGQHFETFLVFCVAGEDVIQTEDIEVWDLCLHHVCVEREHQLITRNGSCPSVESLISLTHLVFGEK